MNRVLLVTVCMALAACAQRTYAPVQPPPPRALTIVAQNGQSQRQQDRDKADCQSVASSRASSSEGWADLFIGCMNGRGYRVD